MVMMAIEATSEGVTVGERVRIARKMRGWSKAELRRVANLKSASTLTELESGAISKTHQLPEIARALGVDVLWLQTGVGRPPVEAEVVLSQEERAVIDFFRASSPDVRKAMLRLVGYS